MCVNLAAGGRRPLKQASIPLVPMQVCRRRDWLGAEFTLTDRMMCAGYEHGGVDTCQARPLFFHRLQNLCSLGVKNTTGGNPTMDYRTRI